MSLTLPIQVGKQYVRRDGAVVTAQKHQPGMADDTVFVLVGNEDYHDAHVFVKNGRSSLSFGVTRRQDLIADHIPATAHPHAALMAQYAADACETAEPWLRWERKGEIDWITPEGNPSWNPGYEYRRKAKTIRIGEHDVPEPFRGTLAHNQTYWTVSIRAGDFDNFSLHMNSFEVTGAKHVASGLVHLTREAAEQHARALLAFTQVQA